jgi:hypothetical protein
MDVFLSYAREDHERARDVATALEQSGWSVWWDRKIITGETFDQTIERELESAKSVVVLWSNTSVASEWVKNEAAAAAERQVLVPALIDDVKIPLEFRRRQTANLIEWDGDQSNEGFQALREGVASRVGTAAVLREPPAPPLRSRRVVRWPRWASVVAVIGVVAAVGMYVLSGNRPADRDSTRVGGQAASVAEQQPAPGGGGSPAQLTVARPRVVSPPASNSIDRPAPLTLGAMHKVTLEQNEAYYFQLPAPANAIKIIEDVRLPKNERSNLQTQLSVLDMDGGVAQADVIRLNQIDVGFRSTASFSMKQPARWGFKLVNLNRTADIWLAVLPENQKSFLPFFGTVVPRPWSAGQDATGTLEQNEDAYYLVRLPRGDNRVILDFINAKHEHRNLQGYLAVLDADGGGQNQIMFVNTVDVSYRQVGSVAVKADGPLILRLQNWSDPVNYNLRIPDAR